MCSHFSSVLFSVGCFLGLEAPSEDYWAFAEHCTGVLFAQAAVSAEECGIVKSVLDGVRGGEDETEGMWAVLEL